ncbi:MAG: hypothetical protein ACLSIG_01120 [Subdoligranulum sp.]|jgi:hypothetical protein|uniref:hypothetical protein n=1 Tax=Ruminococcus sp. TaxID=41978 RepID=UPI002054EB1B|nr:MAG TPA: hypothetical protein [Caudoviricetes sp.]
MHIRIIDAIQEQYGEKYPTLEDALNWWAWPEHWRRGAWDSDFVTGIKTVETAFNRPFKKEEKGLEDAILTALKEMIGEEPGTIEKALERHYRRELLDIWLRYEGLIGYTGEILHVMEALGYDIDTEE